MVNPKDLVLHALALVGGGLLAVYGVVGIINVIFYAFSIKAVVGSLYTLMFGGLVIAIHLVQSDFVDKQFGFLTSNMGRGLCKFVNLSFMAMGPPGRWYEYIGTFFLLSLGVVNIVCHSMCPGIPKPILQKSAPQDAQ
ncbi:hypothetical protein DSO57_1018822 [Entomophthora muscae]|uniref:Uncharacterized protein n=1 Tax=Entomophthora muscae TaxID=34485 RepID=A0ACC2STD7_9FUNG|nr:hypothetical protein DSO57_1018822 [Entomophthora muscae]